MSAEYSNVTNAEVITGSAHASGRRVKDGSAARDSRLDVARGIAMLMVVFGHALAGVMATQPHNQVYTFELIAIYTTHMALFFLISGLLARSMLRRSWPDFWRSVSKTIIWPYLLWSFLILTIHYKMSAFTNVATAGYRPLSILWHPPAVMWFLYSLLVGMVLLRLIRPLPAAVRAALVAAILVSAYVLDGGVLGWLVDSMRFVALYIMAGLVGRELLGLLLKPAVQAASALIMAATLVYAWGEAAQPIDGYPAFGLPYVPALIAGPALLLGLSTVLTRLGGTGWLASALERVGQRTMPIFVVHVLITAGTRIGLNILGIDAPNLVIFCAVALGVLLPMLAASVADRMGVSGLLGWR